ncbi:hypothetical protein T10_8375 [Trichinella papuae]|uniref:Uncharacterized protein n=1 Tax=Trichinella papuae TaxID=268474 RepID=A0A0V1MWQ9_9BILA|nr:hypothetical protein T10_8375 [Trichinella papuae]
MLVKRVEMSQTAAAFGDDKLLIFLFIGIGLENYYFSLFDQNCYSTTSPVHNKATGKASAFVYLLVVVVVVVATRMRCVACLVLVRVQCPEISLSVTLVQLLLATISRQCHCPQKGEQ